MQRIIRPKRSCKITNLETNIPKGLGDFQVGRFTLNSWLENMRLPVVRLGELSQGRTKGVLGAAYCGLSYIKDAEKAKLGVMDQLRNSGSQCLRSGVLYVADCLFANKESLRMRAEESMIAPSSPVLVGTNLIP